MFIGITKLNKFLFNWCRSSFPGVKRWRREVIQSPLPSADVENKWRHSSTSPICLHVVDRENVPLIIIIIIIIIIKHTGTTATYKMVQSVYWLSGIDPSTRYMMYFLKIR
jgi:hypothetical protein